MKQVIPYPQPLRYWDDRSWIRSKPLRSDSIEGYPFPPELVTLLDHEALHTSTELKLKTMAYKLLAHLKFTTVLELEHVNLVCSDLGRGLSPVALTLEQKNDALKIYCDEGGHALFVEHLAKSIETRYGIQSSVLGSPHFHLEMQRLLKDHTPAIPPQILHQFFVAVSETLVTKILRDIPHDLRVSQMVRQVIGDHANDEAMHSVYFRWYFPELWNAIPQEQRLTVGRILPDLIWVFLGPDQETDRRVLQALGFEFRQQEEILAEIYPLPKVAASIREAATPTLEMFRRCGLFEMTEVREAFEKKFLC